MSEELKSQLDWLVRAVDFMDRVRSASEEEKIAVGSDHWNMLEQSARDVVKSYKENGI